MIDDESRRVGRALQFRSHDESAVRAVNGNKNALGAAAAAVNGSA